MILFGIMNYFCTAESREIKLVDAPVSGGVKRAADGTLTV
jgi:3-hydroxyisobutyrate dehydrogenase-like beta-hydroxyacid dehydrogenase